MGSWRSEAGLKFTGAGDKYRMLVIPSLLWGKSLRRSVGRTGRRFSFGSGGGHAIAKMNGAQTAEKKKTRSQHAALPVSLVEFRMQDSR